MELRCSFCGGEVNELKHVDTMKKKAYCSFRCTIADSIPRLVLSLFLTTGLGVILILVGVSNDSSKNVIIFSILFGITILGILIFIIIGSTHNPNNQLQSKERISFQKIRYEKMKAEESFTKAQLIYPESPTISKIAQLVSPETSAISKNTIQCFYCKSKIDFSNSEDQIICMSCGNKIPFCDLCDDYIESEAEILQLEPCGHIFHKKELLEWVKSNKICSKCQVTMTFVDVSPDF